MARHAKTARLIEEAQGILADHHPMTVRQVYYQLVSRQVIENSRTSYQAVSNALVDARKEKVIPWEWIEDRSRRPREVGMWSGLADFAETARAAYRRNIWETQPRYLECWLEKDALSGIFEDILHDYGVTLCVGRGYDGWSSIKWAADRYRPDVTVLYWGDLDPSGEDMLRSLRERLSFFGREPSIVKCALTTDDVARYNLPPNVCKTTDTRRERFVQAHGDISVELDALPIAVLQRRIREEIEKGMDLPALQETKRAEAEDRTRLVELLAAGEARL